MKPIVVFQLLRKFGMFTVAVLHKMHFIVFFSLKRRSKQDFFNFWWGNTKKSPPGNKTSRRRRNDVSLYVPATSQVRLK